ncbi:hypothetical protein [Ktedonospora formicarum]|uniref:hypothetical protein n=1 Tax=Ktedonospora formicarum TaxID=2778364 RepID=UPI001C68F6FA|nr:hypothetical protein [Ktedonospora formicarum]
MMSNWPQSLRVATRPAGRHFSPVAWPPAMGSLSFEKPGTQEVNAIFYYIHRPRLGNGHPPSSSAQANGLTLLPYVPWHPTSFSGPARALDGTAHRRRAHPNAVTLLLS